MRGQKTLLIVVFLVLFLMPAISAEIMISQPNAIYNLGDTFDIQLEVDEFQEGYFDVDMVCTGIDGGNINLFHGVLSAKIIQISRTLIPTYIGGLTGNCHIDAIYGVDHQTSQNFDIKTNVIINLELNKLNYKAGDSIRVKGRATKDNNDVLNGNVEVRLGNETKVVGVVVDGQFDVNFSTLDTMPAGISTLIIEAYDEDSDGNLLNNGEARADLVISQEPEWIELAIDKQVVYPEDSVTIIPFLYDKANYEVLEEEILLKIEDSEGNSVLEKITKTGEEIIFTLESDYPHGHSRIIAEKDEIDTEKVFDVEEYPKIAIEMENGSLIITNIGNVDYDKTIEVSVGGETILKEIDLEMGETKPYELSAPSGEYTVSVKDENGMIKEGNVALTGDAISIQEAGARMSALARYPLVWIFIVVILGLVAFVMWKKLEKKNEFSFPVFFKKHGKKRVDGEKSGPDGEGKDAKKEDGEKKGNNIGFLGLGKKSNIIKPGVISKAEHVLVVNGKKQDAGVVVVKIKNSLSKVAKQELNKALETVYGLKGTPCQVGDSFIIIFSPSVSKSFKNGENAVKSAMNIEKILKEHNKKFKDKIEYGIGVNFGEIINKIEGDNLKFTSLGSTINIAKKIANISKGNALLSKDVHKRTASDVKVESAHEESKSHKMELFKVTRIIDNERNKKFIQDFLKKI